MFQLLAVFFILLFGLIFFLSFFSSNNKESWASSLDHTFSNGSIEAEKELFSAEDVLFLFNSIFFIFGSYFYFLAMSLDMSYTEFTIFYYAIPLLVLSLLWIPINLLYDFGLLFNLYLRGSTNTSNFFFELIFDYIGIVAFFTRLLVQFVRLILMMVVYCMMHDAIVLNTSYNKTLFINVDLWAKLNTLRPTMHNAGWFILFLVPSKIFYWIYEVFHTFFVVTVQFAAFFTIAFWLFLLFYTFFVYEKFEHHFRFLRYDRSYIKAEILSLKNKIKKL